MEAAMKGKKENTTSDKGYIAILPRQEAPNEFLILPPLDEESFKESLKYWIEQLACPEEKVKRIRAYIPLAECEKLKSGGTFDNVDTVTKIMKENERYKRAAALRGDSAFFKKSESIQEDELSRFESLEIHSGRP